MKDQKWVSYSFPRNSFSKKILSVNFIFNEFLFPNHIFLIMQDEIAGYLPSEVLEAGIKSGRFIEGTLNVNRYCANSEAFLKRSG